MRYLLLIGLLVTGVNSMAQDYNVALIPDSLKADADAVLRNEYLEVHIKSLEKTIVKHKYAITIFNENGAEYAGYSNSYDTKSPLYDISGALYDATGKKLRTVKRKDIIDVSMQDGMSLMLDDRIKAHNFFYNVYPYTIEYEEEQDIKGTYQLESWHPVNGDKYGVQQSKYKVIYPSNYQLRYKEYNYTSKPITTSDKENAITWELINYKPVKRELFQPSLDEVLPYIKVGPSDFIRDGFTGSYRTWDDYGKFQLKLNSNRDILPDNIKKDVHQIADGLPTNEEKITALYNYLQKNTRYISIQLGIGGIQPFEAKYVAEKKYGDCKALSNYMVALLKEANIKANYVLVKAGPEVKKGLDETFPAHYSNHAIVCVPNGKDSIWLECTDQDVSAGYMGTFTGNRQVLLIDEKGSYITNTPSYKHTDNLQLRTVTATVDKDGNLQAEVKTHFTGLSQEELHNLLHYYTPEQRTKYLNERISLPTYKIEKNDYKETKARIPAMDETLIITSPNYASTSSKRLFITPNMFNKSTTRLSTDKPRKYDLELSYPFRDIDSVNITIPDGYTVEALPQNINLTNKFGNYKVNYTVNGNTIQLIRLKERINSRFPASDYEELAKFYETMYKADRAKIVFIKKEG
jgi:transglutaminase-like putative cysteine protease